MENQSYDPHLSGWIEVEKKAVSRSCYLHDVLYDLKVIMFQHIACTWSSFSPVRCSRLRQFV